MSDAQPPDEPEERIEAAPQVPCEEPEPERKHRPARMRGPRSLLIALLLGALGALLGGGLAFLLRGEPHDDSTQTAPAPTASGDRQAHPGAPASTLVFSPSPHRPERTPDIITAETDHVFAFYELPGAPADPELRAHWWREGEDMGRLSVRDHRPEHGPGHAAGRFTIVPPGNADEEDSSQAFPAGIYEVEVSAAQVSEATVRSSFVALPRGAKILQGGGEPAGPPVIRDLVTARALTDEGQARDRASIFSPTVHRIYAVFAWHGVAPGAVLTVRWHAGDRALERARTEVAVTATDGTAHAWLEVGEADELPSGEYRVSLHLGDDPEPLATTGFTVSAPDGPAASPPSPTE